jgi:hypothetical protein
MTLWPPDWTLISGIVAFVIASFAVHGWRELGVLVLISALLLFPIKWIAGALGWPSFAADALTFETTASGGWRLRSEATPALLAAIIIAALLMVAAKEVIARRNERRT